MYLMLEEIVAKYNDDYPLEAATREWLNNLVGRCETIRVHHFDNCGCKEEIDDCEALPTSGGRPTEDA